MDASGARTNPGRRRGPLAALVFVIIVLAIWVLLGASLGLQIFLTAPASGHPPPLAESIDLCVRRYLVYAVLTFPALWLCRRFPFSPRRWVAPLLAHTVGLLVFIVLWSAIRMVVAPVIDQETMEAVPLSLGIAMALIRSNLFEQFWMYSSMMTAILAIQHYREFRQRERREADLRRQMAEYELQVLKLQLQPHFLFNTLNGIATLMARDVRAARDMLVRLSELLRIALSRSAYNEIPLREEMEFVKAYLDLEQMRFGERLAVRLEIDPATLDAQVPNMILQPLVENAIEHGIARLTRGGLIALSTDREDGRLHVRIVTDGPPATVAASDPSAGPGIGLGNARSRLMQLYGDAYRLRIAGRSEGGAEVFLEIPFRRPPEGGGPAS